ncbi:hypothetical protein H0H87_007348 [Tephrocybe sp. NHM501043]|nr:hypothetical protein H0H87_007348 [Tephrocybe sp. NHM501043]
MYYPRALRTLNRVRRLIPLPERINPPNPEEFFQHTAGRWLVNEPFQLSQRYLKFNVDALKAAAVSAVHGAKSVKAISKFNETDYTKILSLLLDNGQKVIARLPTPLSGNKRLVTASQVATSEFARQRLGTDPYEYLFSICDREEQWIDKYGRVKGLDYRLHHPKSARDPDTHLHTLGMFGQVIPYVVPTDNENLIHSTLSHPVGLDGTNVWLSESALAEGRIEISAITDWQHAVAKPMYLTAHLPALIDYDVLYSEKHPGTDLPEAPPENTSDTEEAVFDSESKDDTERMKYEEKMCIVGYRRLAKTEAYNYYVTMMEDTQPYLFATLAHAAATAWGESFHLLRVRLYRVQKMWELLTPCPYEIADEEADMMRQESQASDELEIMIHALQRMIGFVDKNGWTPPEYFDEVREHYRDTQEIFSD